jgi:hypothetical protein
MKIFRVSLPSALRLGWDSYDSFVCVAQDEDEARHLHPSGCKMHRKHCSDWIDMKKLHLLIVEYVGEAKEEYKEACILCASFHAG